MAVAACALPTRCSRSPDRAKSGLFVVGALVIKLTGRSIPGWTSTVLAVSVIGAIQLLCLGLLGEYVARLFQPSQRPPARLALAAPLDRTVRPSLRTTSNRQS